MHASKWWRVPMRLSVLALVVLAAGCVGDGILSAENVVKGGQIAVTVSDQGFKPNSVTIAAGDSVSFSWYGNNTNPHQVVVTGFASGPQQSPNQRSGSWMLTFPAAGDYVISDADNAGFTGTVTVIQ